MTECITLNYNVWVSREDVRKARKEIDPEGVDRRRRKVIHRRVYESLGPGIYTTWMVMINLNVGVCVYMDALTHSARR